MLKRYFGAVSKGGHVPREAGNSSDEPLETVKRLFDSSRGTVELELGTGLLSAWLFDSDGRVVTEACDEWVHTEVEILLHQEIGLPEDEARAIEQRFLEAARAVGHEEAPPDPGVGFRVLGWILTGVFWALLALLVVGVWTTVTWLF